MAAIYSFDTSSLIHAWRRAYPPQNFPKFWAHLDGLAKSGRMFMSDQVLRDLEKKDDDVFEWCNGLKPAHRAIDEALQDHVTELMGNYPRLVDTVKGRSASDPWVIALARANRSWIVVCEENPGKMRMPDVCNSEGIKCIRLVQLIQDEGWVF